LMDRQQQGEHRRESLDAHGFSGSYKSSTASARARIVSW
jgi:hypothetical protein